MRRYLNQNQKRALLILAAATCEAEKLPGLFKLTGREKAKANTIKTLGMQVAGFVTDGLDNTQKAQTIRAIANYTIEAAPRCKDFTAQEKEDSETALCNIADFAVGGNCKACSGDESYIDACELRKALINFSIPVFKSECEDGECPYRMVKGEK